MRTVTENALAVTQSIVEDYRKELEESIRNLRLVETKSAQESVRKNCDVLHAVERVMRNLGLDN